MRPRLVRTGLLLLAIVGIPSSESYAGCRGLSAEEVGEGLGRTLLEVAKAFVRAGVWDNPQCESAKTREMRELCSMMDDVDDAIERVNKSVDRKCFDDAGPFAQSADYYVFSILKQGLASDDPKLRWQVLMRMYLICRQGVMLTDAGSKECPTIIEQTCIDTLSQDKDPFNRHLALEILSRSYVTEHARAVLEEIIRTAPSPRGQCPHGFHSQTNPAVRPMPWESIARGYQAGDLSCEGELAKEALDHLHSTGPSR